MFLLNLQSLIGGVSAPLTHFYDTSPHLKRAVSEVKQTVTQDILTLDMAANVGEMFLVGGASGFLSNFLENGLLRKVGLQSYQRVALKQIVKMYQRGGGELGTRLAAHLIGTTANSTLLTLFSSFAHDGDFNLVEISRTFSDFSILHPLRWVFHTPLTRLNPVTRFLLDIPLGGTLFTATSSLRLSLEDYFGQSIAEAHPHTLAASFAHYFNPFRSEPEAEGFTFRNLAINAAMHAGQTTAGALVQHGVAKIEQTPRPAAANPASSEVLARKKSVVIVGGGASGMLTATHLLRGAKEPMTIHLIEGNAEHRAGLAYSTEDAQHLLNVRAANMSAFPEDPKHFFNWLQAKGYHEFQETSFAPRKIYGEYLQDVLREAEAVKASGVELVRVRDQAVALEIGENSKWVLLESGEKIPADQIVSPVGNAEPADIIPLDGNLAFYESERLKAPEHRLYVKNPFERGLEEFFATKKKILLEGLGLTTADASLSIYLSNPEVEMTAFSRGGEWPAVHEPYKAFTADEAEAFRARFANKNLEGVIREVRSVLEADAENWRRYQDALRPITNQLWTSFSFEEQQIFLRDFARLWDIHRHRMPGETRAKLDQMGDRLRTRRACLHSIQEREGQVEVVFRDEHGRLSDPEHFDLLVNCTGPDTDYERIRLRNRWVDSLMRQGLARANRLRLGLRVNSLGYLIGEGDLVSDFLSTLGPTRKGEGEGLFETTAMPEIRGQAQRLANEILLRLRNVVID